MPSLDFRNTNTLWASVLVETLSRLGVTHAVICPGSRSGPLAVAFANHGQIQAVPVLDERSASFFALGLARQSGRPVTLVCTSGTAAANFFPAVIEAAASQVPLLVLTADRPPELRDCHAGQSIDQLKLYGSYPRWQAELALPAADISLLNYLRQTVYYAWERSLLPSPGPVHLNLPFREPLAPQPGPSVQPLATTFPDDFWPDDFWPRALLGGSQPALTSHLPPPWSAWLNCQGLILAGPVQPADPEAYCQAVAILAKTLGWPVLAEALSPLRNYADLNPHLVSSYDWILRQPELADKLVPQQVLQLGELPTSKELRQWLQQHRPRTWVIDPCPDNFDPLHGATTPLRLSVLTLANLAQNGLFKTVGVSEVGAGGNLYLRTWQFLEQKLRHRRQQTLASMEWLFEGKVSWVLSQNLPPATPLYVASSMPVRDLEWFWQPGNLRVQPYFNRGTNGIDGTLSTALGIAHHQQPSVLLTGDLALLHDTNGFLLRQHWQGHLTIVLLNNNGGGIFNMLPIAEFDPPFTEFFATPQNLNFACLCATYGVEYELITSWAQLGQRLQILPASGLRLLEVPCDRQRDSLWRQQNLSTFAQGLSTGELLAGNHADN